MKVLLTGGSGFLGSHIAEQLSQSGHTVLALVRRNSNRKFLQTLKGVEFVDGTIEDAASLDHAAKGVDAIIHSAGLVKARTPQDFVDTNVTGTENLLNAAKKNAANLKRFVFVSSLAGVGPSLDGKPVSSAHTPNPVTHYGRSKLAAEQLVRSRKAELPVTVIRPPAIYGPRDTETFAFFESISRGVLPILGDGRNTLSVIYGADAADACIKAITADVPSGNAYFVDDGQVYVWKDAVSDIERALGKRAFVRFGLPFPVVHAAALATEFYGKVSNKAVMLTRDKLNELRAPHWVCNSDDTRRDLGWTPRVLWSEGTAKAAAWYKQNGWL